MALAGEHLQVFDALDAAKTQWYHIRVLMVTAMGFFTVSYDLNSFIFLNKLLGRIYYPNEGTGVLPRNIATAVNGVSLCGTLAGNLFLGYFGDEKGRKCIYGKALKLLVICSMASGLSCGKSPTAVMSTLCFFQFWIGFGAGGVYSLSATIMAEYANKRRRGTFIALVFTMHGFGFLAAGIVTFVVSAVFKAKYPAPSYQVDPTGSTVLEADYVWRLELMLGAVPAAFTYYLLSKLPETTRYTALVAKDAKRAVADLPKQLQVDLEAEQEKLEQYLSERGNDFGLFSVCFVRQHGLHLLGTTAPWFLMGIALYSYNAVLKDLLSLTGWIPKAKKMNAIEEVYQSSRAEVLIQLIKLVPGYLLAVCCIDKIGRLRTQFTGFFFMAVSMFVLAIPDHHWNSSPVNRVGLFVTFSLLSISSRLCKVTAFVLAAEIFPARLRSTCHGISAASARAGQLVGTFWFLFVEDAVGKKITFAIFGIFCFLGMLLTLLLPETNGKSLEESSGEAK